MREAPQRCDGYLYPRLAVSGHPCCVVCHAVGDFSDSLPGLFIPLRGGMACLFVLPLDHQDKGGQNPTQAQRPCGDVGVLPAIEAEEEQRAAKHAIA